MLLGAAYSAFPRTIQERGPGWRELHEPSVVLEIKFTNTLPAWAWRIIQGFHLMRTSICKYGLCVKAMQRERMLPTSAGIRRIS